MNENRPLSGARAMRFAQSHGLCAQLMCCDPEEAKIPASAAWVEGPEA